MEKQPPYLHLKYKGLFQPYSWPFCSSIITVDTADKFIYLNSTLPSSAVIADKYLSAFKTSWILGFLQNHVWSNHRITHPESVFEESGFVSVLLYGPPQNSHLWRWSLFPQCCLRTSLGICWRDHASSIELPSHSTISPSIETFLKPYRHWKPSPEFVRSVPVTPLKKTSLQEMWTEIYYNILSVSMAKCRQPGG